MALARIGAVACIEPAKFGRDRALNRQIEGRDFLLDRREIVLFPEWCSFGLAHGVRPPFGFPTGDMNIDHIAASAFTAAGG
jgi:hypothetical protein